MTGMRGANSYARIILTLTRKEVIEGYQNNAFEIAAWLGQNWARDLVDEARCGRN